MNNLEFITATRKLEQYFDKNYTLEQLKIMFEELKELELSRYNQIITNIIRTNKFLPKIAEIKSEIDGYSFKNSCNLDSCYWYINLRNACDEEGIPYYDIAKGPNFPLPPYK